MRYWYRADIFLMRDGTARSDSGWTIERLALGMMALALLAASTSVAAARYVDGDRAAARKVRQEHDAPIASNRPSGAAARAFTPVSGFEYVTAPVDMQSDLRDSLNDNQALADVRDIDVRFVSRGGEPIAMLVVLAIDEDLARDPDVRRSIVKGFAEGVGSKGSLRRIGAHDVTVFEVDAGIRAYLVTAGSFTLVALGEDAAGIEGFFGGLLPRLAAGKQDLNPDTV